MSWFDFLCGVVTGAAWIIPAYILGWDRGSRHCRRAITDSLGDFRQFLARRGGAA